MKYRNPTVIGSWTQQETAIVCVDVSKNSESEVIEAIAAWDKAIGSWKRLVYHDGIIEGCSYTIKEVTPGPQVNPISLAQVSAIGGKEILLFKGRYEADVLGIVLHELGHAFGARHMAGTLMNPSLLYKVHTCPDAATVAQVAVANNLNLLEISWCSRN